MNAMLRAQQEVFDIMPDSKIGMEMAKAFEEAERPFKIKPLGWVREDARYFRAETAIGSYGVNVLRSGLVDFDGGRYTDVDTAKAAAQADYERRILSALEWGQ